MSALVCIVRRYPVSASLLAYSMDWQKRWAAKGGRGRKKPKSLSVEFLFSNRRRGRPKLAKCNTPAYKNGSRYASRHYHQDRSIIYELIALAPQRPETHIRALVAELVEQSKKYDKQLGHFNGYKSLYRRHVDRIMLRISRTMAFLQLPHKRYAFERKKK